MSRRYRVFLIVLAAALACAGLPAHACPGKTDVGAEDHTQMAMAASVNQSDCPFHAAATEEPGDSTIEVEADCCMPDCGCGCSAPVPGPMITVAGETPPGNDAISAIATRFDPSLPAERLLRPPQAHA